MDSLISYEGAADVINNLVDKLSGAVGWIATHNTPKREALSTYIAEVQKMDIDPLEKAALISNAKRSIKEYTNQQNVVKNALCRMNSNSRPQAVEDDWIAQLMDKVRLVSDANFQAIWGAILASECNEPGSIPKALLHVLSQMDRKHAEGFALICSLSVCLHSDHGVEYAPIIPYYQYENFFKSVGLKYEVLVDLKAIGLIDVSMPSLDFGAFVMDELEGSVVTYFDQKYIISEEATHLHVGGVIFTRVGHALCSAIGQNKIDGFFEECCLPFWKVAEAE